jgi:cellobiose phosphorylase
MVGMADGIDVHLWMMEMFFGSMENDECRIDSIAQSWSVISNAGDNDKKYISMESLENHLIDKENGIIKLLDPPFEKGKLEPGYIKAYLPGVRENGGQYTHEYCACGQFYKILILLNT